MAFLSHTVMQLRALLKDRNLPYSGKKPLLIERLIESIKIQHGIRDCRVILSRINLDEYSKKDTGLRERKTGRVANSNPSTSSTALPSHGSAQQANDDSAIGLRKRKAGRVNNSNPSTSPTTSTSSGSAQQANNTSAICLSKKKAGIVFQISKKKIADESPKKKSRRMSSEEVKSKPKRQKKRKRIANQTKKIASTALCLRPALRNFEMVWAHVRGFRNWPGIIEKETKNGKYLIHFFGDYSESEVRRNKIMHLMEGFKNYAAADQPTRLLLKAIGEAKLFILEQNRKSCPICQMLELKSRMTTK